MGDATARKLLATALQATSETEADLIAVAYQQKGENYGDWLSIVLGLAADLPTEPFDSGYGGAEGPRVIAWSKRFVYVCGEYDGAEWMEAVPRNPDDVPFIPRVGG